MKLLPHIDIPTLGKGKIAIQPFGILVASGVLLATWMARKYAERNRLDEDVLRWLGIRLLVWGWLACHVFNTFFYEWDRFVDDPLLLLKVWDGISSWGGVIGGAVAFYVYTGIKKMDRLRWADLCAYGAIGGWMPGRGACAVVHDHLGYPTDFVLGVDFPPGTYAFDKMSAVTIRAHDLGLYEFLVLIPIFIAMLLLERWKGRRPGFLLGFLAVTYSVPRFMLEFLRRPEADPRYFGLTFAQYACILAFIAGVVVLVKSRKREPGLPEEVPAAEPAPTAKPMAKKKKKKK